MARGRPEAGSGTAAERRVRLLVIEDEWLVVARIAQALDGTRFEIAATAPSVAHALASLGREHFDAAILDCNLSGEMTGTLSRQLRAAGIPFLLVTANRPHRHANQWDGAPVLLKPFAKAALRSAAELLVPPNDPLDPRWADG